MGNWSPWLAHRGDSVLVSVIPLPSPVSLWSHLTEAWERGDLEKAGLSFYRTKCLTPEPRPAHRDRLLHSQTVVCGKESVEAPFPTLPQLCSELNSSPGDIARTGAVDACGPCEYTLTSTSPYFLLCSSLWLVLVHSWVDPQV